MLMEVFAYKSVGCSQVGWHTKGWIEHTKAEGGRGRNSDYCAYRTYIGTYAVELGVLALTISTSTAGEREGDYD